MSITKQQQQQQKKMETTTTIVPFYFMGTRNVNGVVRQIFGTVSKMGNMVAYTMADGMPWIERGLPLIQKKAGIVGIQSAMDALKMDTIGEITKQQFTKSEMGFLLLVEMPKLESLLETVKTLKERESLLGLIDQISRLNVRTTSVVRTEAKRKIKALQ